MDVPVPLHVVALEPVPVTTARPVVLVTPVKVTDREPAGSATVGVMLSVHTTVLEPWFRTMDDDVAEPVRAWFDAAANAGAATAIETAGAVQAAVRMTVRREAARWSGRVWAG